MLPSYIILACTALWFIYSNYQKKSPQKNRTGSQNIKLHCGLKLLMIDKRPKGKGWIESYYHTTYQKLICTLSSWMSDCLRMPSCIAAAKCEVTGVLCSSQQRKIGLAGWLEGLGASSRLWLQNRLSWLIWCKAIPSTCALLVDIQPIIRVLKLEEVTDSAGTHLLFIISSWAATTCKALVQHQPWLKFYIFWVVPVWRNKDINLLPV